MANGCDQATVPPLPPISMAAHEKDTSTLVHVDEYAMEDIDCRDRPEPGPERSRPAKARNIFEEQRALRRGEWKSRLHTTITCMLCLFLIFAMSAAVYQPFRASWETIDTSVKVMGGVGAVGGTACSDPCMYYAGAFTPLTMAQTASRFPCPPVSSDVDSLVRRSVHSATHGKVSKIEYRCTPGPGGFAVEDGVLVLDPHLFETVLQRSDLVYAYLAYAGTAALVAEGRPPVDAYRTIINKAEEVWSRHILPPMIDKRELVRAGGAQVLCGHGADARELKPPLGCV